MYKEGLKKTKVATTAISLMISAVPGCGWGLSAVSLASSYGGYSALEKAVHKAYYKKGIKVYYKIFSSGTVLVLFGCPNVEIHFRKISLIAGNSLPETISSEHERSTTILFRSRIK